MDMHLCMVILGYIWFVAKGTVGQSLARTYLYPADTLEHSWVQLGALGYAWIPQCTQCGYQCNRCEHYAGRRCQMMMI